MGYAVVIKFHFSLYFIIYLGHRETNAIYLLPPEGPRAERVPPICLPQHFLRISVQYLSHRTVIIC